MREPPQARTGAAAGTAVVTGGASGIGLAVAGRLLADGWRVAIWDVSATALEAAGAALAAAHGADPGCLHLEVVDICDEAATEAAGAAAARALGRLDGLVNSAGIGLEAPFHQTSAADFRRILDVNVVGSFLSAKAVAPHLRDGGAIVNIGSVSGARGNVDRVAYGASKGAVATMTQVLAVELAPRNIRVNAVAPGPVDTPLTRVHHTPVSRAGWHEAVPLARYGSVEEIAGAVAFLLGADAAYVTGHILNVDGGFSAGGLRPGRR